MNIEQIVTQATPDQARSALQTLLQGLSDLGFGADGDINGGDAVDGVGKVFKTVLSGVLSTGMRSRALKLTDAQRVLLKTFGDGEFAHLLEAPNQEEFDFQIAKCGHGLLRYLVRELSADEDCTSMSEGMDRVERSRDDLADVLQSLAAGR